MGTKDKKQTSDYYNSHWRNFAAGQYPDSKLLQASHFFAPIINNIRDNQSVLDVGCGDGVHWFYLKKNRKLHIRFTGIDISQSSIDFLGKLTSDKNDSFMQMDASELQFDRDLFDIVFAYGVIGYAENPFKVFKEMVRVCKPGGQIGIFSPEISGISKIILSATRSIAQLLNKRGQKVLADILVPFFGLAPSETGINLKNATWQQVREVILTDIAPPHLEIIAHQTLLDWFKEQDFKIVSDDTKTKIMIWGIKPESESSQ